MDDCIDHRSSSNRNSIRLKSSQKWSATTSASSPSHSTYLPGVDFTQWFSNFPLAGQSSTVGQVSVLLTLLVSFPSSKLPGSGAWIHEVVGSNKSATMNERSGVLMLPFVFFKCPIVT
jgi:hypothetical protein